MYSIMKKKSLTLLIFLTILIACNQDACVSASCIAPPNGTFVNGVLNLAIGSSVLEKSEDGSYINLFEIDSVSINSSIIKEFYTWFQVEMPSSINSMIIYSGTQEIQVESESFFPISSGGYIMSFIRGEETFSIKGEEASQDLINGVCNDVITCR